MKKKYRPWVALVLAVVLLLSLLPFAALAAGNTALATAKQKQRERLAAGEAAHSWYVRRNSEHKQPTTDLPGLSEYGAYYVDAAHGDASSDKVVYLTFDAGYENGNIAKIMDALQAEKVPAAFFILKNLITHDTELVKRMQKEGHTVCNHTMSHKDMTRVASRDAFAAELAGLEAVYREYTGEEMAKYYRPPEGKYSMTNLKYASELGYKTVFWSFAYADWDNAKQPDPETAKQKILDNLHNGAVILLHPTSATNATIMTDLIREIRAQGYRFGTLDELTGS